MTQSQKLRLLYLVNELAQSVGQEVTYAYVQRIHKLLDKEEKGNRRSLRESRLQGNSGFIVAIKPDLATGATKPIHTPMEAITDDIYLDRSPLRLMGVNLQRSYTVIRHGGTVSIISPTDSMDHDAILALGPVAHIVAPTCFHDTGMRAAAKAFPNATLWGVPGIAKHLPGLKLLELRHDQLPKEWNSTIQCFPLKGMPKVNEHVIWHQPSETLITSDLIFNIQPPVDIWTQFFFRMNGAWNKPGPTRIFRACIKDSIALATSVQTIKELPIQRILPAHGSPLTTPDEIAQTLARL